MLIIQVYFDKENSSNCNFIAAIVTPSRGWSPLMRSRTDEIILKFEVQSMYLASTFFSFWSFLTQGFFRTPDFLKHFGLKDKVSSVWLPKRMANWWKLWTVFEQCLMWCTICTISILELFLKWSSSRPLNKGSFQIILLLKISWKIRFINHRFPVKRFKSA